MICFGILLWAQPVYLMYKLIKLTVKGRDSDEQEGADEENKLVYYWIAGLSIQSSSLYIFHFEYK
jgi:hypothetical protein